MKHGFWNYTEPITFTGVTYEVTKDENHPLYWQNMHVGKRRQALQVTTVKTKERPEEETFLIDNEHGDGYYKIFSGKGSPGFGHKSVMNPVNIEPIPDEQITTRYDHKSIVEENKLHDEHMKEIDPKEYERIASLKRMIDKNANLKIS